MDAPELAAKARKVETTLKADESLAKVYVEDLISFILANKGNCAQLAIIVAIPAALIGMEFAHFIAHR